MSLANNPLETCCFTGHRPEMLPWGEDEQSLEAEMCREKLKEQIILFYEKGCRYFMTGMARGIDLMAAEIVLELQSEDVPVGLQCIIPYRQQARGFPPKDQHRYQTILSKAEQVKVLEEQYTRPCLLDRNRYMVDHAEYVIAVYNQSGKGGTFHTVRYALKKGRQLTILNPEHLVDDGYHFF